MLNINNFLEKFVRIQNKNKDVKEFVLKTIKDISGVSIDSKNLDINDQKFYINCSPLVRNQIFLFKNKIILELKKNKINIEIY